MSTKNLRRWVSLILFIPGLACGMARQTLQPRPEFEQLAFEIQTATPTTPAVLSLIDVSTETPAPGAVVTSAITLTQVATTTQVVTTTQAATATVEPEATVEEAAAPETATPTVPAATPQPTPTIVVAEPLRGGEWDFEVGFTPWGNPHGDVCPGSGLANGWNAFTTRDQYGSSCMNQTTWRDNVYTGESAQEITFAYVGNQAGIFKTAPTTPGHRYSVEAYTRREFSPAQLEVFLGIDLSGGTNWQAETVQWFPWDESFDDQWARTEETVTATGDNMTIFIQGSHPYPEPGGALRIDSISIVDLGPG